MPSFTRWHFVFSPLMPHPKSRKSKMRLFSLYVGTNQPGAKIEILRLVRERFGSFTLIQGEGFFRGVSEPVWIVKIATDDFRAVLATAAQIRAALDQDGVGIEYAGQYHRVTKDNPAAALRRLFRRQARRAPGKALR
jgi:hypothetical protein